MKNQIFVLCPEVLALNPDAIHQFKKGTVVIPMCTLAGLRMYADGVKSRDSDNGCSALEFADRTYELLRGKSSGDLMTREGGQLLFYRNGERELGQSTRNSNTTDSIIDACKKLQVEHPNAKVTLVTTNPFLMVFALLDKIHVEPYKKNGSGPVDTLPSGFAELSVAHDAIQTIHRTGKLSLKESGLSGEVVNQLSHNTCCILHNESQKGNFVLSTFNRISGHFVLVQKNRSNKESQVEPKTPDQTFALHLAKDPSIRLLTLIGKPGSGKTLMALLAWHHLYKANQMCKAGQPYKLVVFRPIQDSSSKEVGFLPGDIDEKMAPRSLPIFENLELILAGKEGNSSSARKELKKLIEAGIVRVEPPNFLRGGTIRGENITVVDEGQNFSPDEMLTILTRAGEGSRVIITGDVRQIDGRLNRRNCGISTVIERFHGQEHYAHFTLRECVRSWLAKTAYELMA